MGLNQQFRTTFINASGVEDSLCCSLLENTGLQVEIEPGRQCAVQGTNQAGHRMQLLTRHE